MPEKRRDSRGRILRNGEVQRPDGKYMFRYTDHKGQRHTVYSWKLVNTDKSKDGRRNQQALRDIEQQILKDLADGINLRDAAHITVNDLFKQFLDIRKDLRESTRCCYSNLYKKHVEPVLGGRQVDKVKPTEIQKLYQEMVNSTGVNPTTAQKTHSIIYQIFENAVMDNLIRSNPATNAFRNLSKIVSSTTTSRDPLTTEQQERLIDYVYASKQYCRIANLFTVLLGTGMRIGEALGLRWCDCDFDEGIIHVTHSLLYKQSEEGGYRYRISAPKTNAGFREIPMFDEVKAALLRERKKRHTNKKKFVVDGYSGFIFLNNNGQVYTQSFIYDAIQGITTSYNKEEYAKAIAEERPPCYLPKISAHILRHTFCTRMYENKADIKVLQETMGHKNIRTTMETYTKAFRDKKIETIQALNGAFKLS